MDWPVLDPLTDLTAEAPPPAGAGQGARPPDDRGEPDHVRELALFLAVHYDRAPGVLWPEHEPPAPGPGPDGTSELTRRLALLTGLAAAPCEGPAVREHGHLLVYQSRGSRTWDLTGPGPTGADRLRYRLRAGEVLYVPAHWARRPEPAHRTARETVLVLRPAVD
ncbi:hypothetical protein [Streptomyces sp. NPDC097619]|uniref:hypothetical protein n=1 Tax=Streptomyces sp. NPDC097619 TaxID=3157228 RepID=UPI003334462C